MAAADHDDIILFHGGGLYGGDPPGSNARTRNPVFHVKHRADRERPSTMLSVIPVLVAAATALTMALSIPLAVPQPPAPATAAAIEFRQAQTEAGPGLTPVEKDGQTLYLWPDVIVSTAEIASAEQGFDPLWGQPIVSLVLNDAGRDRLAAFTQTHIGKILAITVDGALLTAPVIREPIMGGALQISGVQSLAEALDLARRLGRPPVPATRSLAEALGADLP